MNLGGLLFGAEMLRIVISSWCSFPLMSVLCPSLSLLISFVSKSVFLFLFFLILKWLNFLAHWVYLLGISFYLEVMSIFEGEVCFSDAAEIWLLFCNLDC